jgi:hypothetical protein
MVSKRKCNRVRERGELDQVQVKRGCRRCKEILIGTQRKKINNIGGVEGQQVSG